MDKRKMWCLVHSDGRYDYSTLALTRKDCIEKSLVGLNMTYDELKKKDWIAIKVFVTITFNESFDRMKKIFKA